uniref:Uncharacterized protein n=1 Tax=Clandestinovirus TaxID=2831644 RepID=A0A8F8KLY8_9VIRU|nr:hypothetical protein KOM_12_313 [Clandestinovirus]
MAFPVTRVTAPTGTFEFRKSSVIDSLRNRQVKRISSDRSVTEHARNALLTTGTVDVTQSYIANGIDDEGVRVSSVIKGVDRLPLTQRTVTFQGNAAFLPEPFIIDTANNINVDKIGVPFDPVFGVFNAFNDEEPSLGLTLQNDAFFTGAIRVKDVGMYSCRFLAELIIPTTVGTNLSFYIDFITGEQDGDLRLVHSIYIYVPAGTNALRADVTAPTIAPFYDITTNFFVNLGPTDTLSVLISEVTMDGDGVFNLNTVDLKLCMLDAK